MFQEKRTPKKFFTFQETEIYYITGKEYSKPYYQGTFIILQERNIQNPDITELSFISGN